MLLEVKKIKNQYVIKNSPITSEDEFYLQIEKKNILKRKPEKKTGSDLDTALEQLRNLATKFPDNIFINSMIENYVPYTNPPDKTDDDFLYDALKEKYGI